MVSPFMVPTLQREEIDSKQINKKSSNNKCCKDSEKGWCHGAKLFETTVSWLGRDGQMFSAETRWAHVLIVVVRTKGGTNGRNLVNRFKRLASGLRKGNLRFLVWAANERQHSLDVKCLSGLGLFHCMRCDLGQITSPLCLTVLICKVDINVVHTSWSC